MTQALHWKTERLWKRKLISNPLHTRCLGVPFLSLFLYSPLPRLPSFRPKEHRNNNTPPRLSALVTHTHTHKQTHVPGKHEHQDFSTTTHAALHASIGGATHILQHINSTAPKKNTGGCQLRSHVNIPGSRG